MSATLNRIFIFISTSAFTLHQKKILLHSSASHNKNIEQAERIHLIMDLFIKCKHHSIYFDLVNDVKKREKKTFLGIEWKKHLKIYNRFHRVGVLSFI